MVEKFFGSTQCSKFTNESYIRYKQLPTLFETRLSSSHQPSSSRSVRATNRQISPAGCQFLSRVTNSRSYTAPDASKDGTSIIDLCARRGFAPHTIVSTVRTESFIRKLPGSEKRHNEQSHVPDRNGWIKKRGKSRTGKKGCVRAHFRFARYFP